jgi:hypothetical protein
MDAELNQDGQDLACDSMATSLPLTLGGTLGDVLRAERVDSRYVAVTVLDAEV